MTTRPAIPSTDKILAKALQRFYELRPRSFAHINLRSGRYWEPFLGYRAQIATNVNRLAGLVRDSFASTATGDALIAWVASECAESPDTSETTAIGSLTIARGPGSTLAAGDIPKGTRFSRKASPPSSAIVFPAASYETLTDAHFDAGQTAPITIPIRATSPGPSSNHPILDPAAAHGVSTPTLFDSTLTVTAFEAAGGASKMDDPSIRNFAKIVTPGLYGPTKTASILGALRTPGVRHGIAFDDVTTGTQRVLIADESWASSTRLAALVEQGMYSAGLVGFGCRVSAAGVRNKLISIDATVRLRDTRYLSDTTEFAEAIRKSARSYFDDRADWNVWKTAGLKGAVIRAHRAVLNCTSVVVKDAAGSVLSEIVSPNYTQEQFHYLLASNAMRITFMGPS